MAGTREWSGVERDGENTSMKGLKESALAKASAIKQHLSNHGDTVALILGTDYRLIWTPFLTTVLHC